MILEGFIVDYLHLVSYNIIIKNITYYLKEQLSVP